MAAFRLAFDYIPVRCSMLERPMLEQADLLPAATESLVELHHRQQFTEPDLR
jgi:hypothetical protein